MSLRPWTEWQSNLSINLNTLKLFRIQLYCTAIVTELVFTVTPSVDTDPKQVK